jgi:hypothetical protein
MGEVPEVRLHSLLLFSDERNTRSKRADNRRIEELNESANEGTTYKVIWLARHGQGVHNVVCPLHLLHHILLPLSSSLVPLLLVGGMETDEKAEEKYGTRAWNRKWSLLEGDGELVWVSPPSDHSSFHFRIFSVAACSFGRSSPRHTSDRNVDPRDLTHSSLKRVKTKYAKQNPPGRGRLKKGYPYPKSYIRVH